MIIGFTGMLGAGRETIVDFLKYVSVNLTFAKEL